MPVRKEGAPGYQDFHAAARNLSVWHTISIAFSKSYTECYFPIQQGASGIIFKMEDILGKYYKTVTFLKPRSRMWFWITTQYAVWYYPKVCSVWIRSPSDDKPCTWLKSKLRHVCLHTLSHPYVCINLCVSYASGKTVKWRLLARWR